MQSNNKITIISEIANAHQGEYKIAQELASRAVNSGADAIKFQIYFADELLVKHHPRYNHFKNQQFKESEWQEIFDFSKQLNTKIYADIFGFEALKVFNKFKLDGIKIHSSDLLNIPLLKEAASSSNKIFLSAGGSTIVEISNAIDAIREMNKEIEIIILYGYQLYPTEINDTNLLRLKNLIEHFKHIKSFGIMDHVSAEHKFSKILPLLAIPLGIKYIEKHITLSRKEKGVDYYSSLEPDEFKDFVLDVRTVESLLGDNPDMINNAEQMYRETVKKKWVAAQLINKGNIITEKDLVLKRTEDLKEPQDYFKLINTKAARNIQIDEVIKIEDILSIS